MKRILIYIVKLTASGTLALIFLSVFCFFYDNAPIVVEQPLEITNYRYRAHTTWFDMTEGFGWGKTNNLGYNDQYDFDNCLDPVIVFLGSSHTEAFQMTQEKTCVSKLQERLFSDDNKNNDFPCLNLGVSGHDFEISASNLEYVAEYFDKAKYVVIEARELLYSPEEFQKILDGKYHDPLKKDGKISEILEKYPVLRNPFLRTLKKQYDRVERIQEASKQLVPPLNVDYIEYKAELAPVLETLSSISKEYGFQIIIVYHHQLKIDDEYGLIKTDDSECVQIFSETCKQNGIEFIDISDVYISNYNSNYGVPYGFANTAAGEGHMNALGHSIMAEVLYNNICVLEKEK